jgi:hypothetical protein
VIGSTIKLILFAALCSMLACAHAPMPPSCADFGTAQYCLQPMSATDSFSATQMVTRTCGEDVAQLVLQIEAGADGLRMAGVTPFGRRLFLISFDNNDVTVSSDIPLDRPLSAAHMLAGWQLAYLPWERTVNGFSAANMDLQEQNKLRKLSVDGKLVFQATCDGNRPRCQRAVVSYPALGCTLTAETLDEANSER